MLGLTVLFVISTAAQRPADAPATAPGGKPPDTVFLEDLTWAEVRDLVAAGTTTVIIGTAGTEQKGPHMVDGEHKFVMEYAADKIARALGKTLVAPVITYVPEGSWENPGGHMGKPGTITLPEDRFVELLVSAGRSLKSGGFTTILFLGESGGNRTGMRTAADKLNELWKGAATRVLGRRLLHEVARRSERLRHRRRSAFPTIRSAATPTSSTRPRCCSSTPKHVRTNKLAPGGGYENSGVSGDPIEVDAGARQGASCRSRSTTRSRRSRALMAGTDSARRPPAAGAGGGGGGGGGGGAAAADGRRRRRRPARRGRRWRRRRRAFRRRRRPTRSSSTS